MEVETKDMGLAYTAGFFDGDGSLGVYWHKNKSCYRGGYFELDVRIAQHHYLPLFDLLLEQFGGSLHYAKTKRMWVWRVTAAKALHFLVAILPYLRVKKAQAKLAIQFQERKGRHSGRGTSASRFAWEREIAAEIKRLKKVSHSHRGSSLFQRVLRGSIQRELPFL